MNRLLWIGGIPSLLFLLFWIVSLFQNDISEIPVFKHISYDRRAIRRGYYLFSFIWMILSVNACKYDIYNLKIIGWDKSRLSNFVIVILISCIFIILWDFIFISCRNIKTFIFKDIQITADQAMDIKRSVDMDWKEYTALEHALDAENIIIGAMDEYIKYCIYQTESNEDAMYRELIRKYRKERKNIRIFVYPWTDSGYVKMKKELSISETRLSGIMYALTAEHICVPEDVQKDIVYSIVSTGFNGEYIVVMVSDCLYRNEYMVINNIVQVFDACLQNECNRYLCEQA